MSTSQHLCTLCLLPRHTNTLLQCPEMQLQLRQAQLQGEEDIMAKARKENASCPSLSLKRSRRSLSPLTPPGKSLKRPGEGKNDNLPTQLWQKWRIVEGCEKRGSGRQGKKFPLSKETQARQTILSLSTPLLACLQSQPATLENPGSSTVVGGQTWRSR